MSEDAANPAPVAALAEDIQQLSLALHDARLRARSLALALEDVWKVHLATRRAAERAGLLPPL